jgi:hypothetical protein
MPFGSQFDRVLSVIESACESPQLQLSCARADDVATAGHIMERVLNGILQSEYIVADLTGKNPNVFYELGVAHCCKAPSNVIMISQNPDDVPFDVRSLNYLTYQSSDPGHKELKRQLIEAMQGNEYRFSVAANERHKLPQPLSGRDRLAYEVEILDTIVGPGFAKPLIRVKQRAVGEDPISHQPMPHFLEIGRSVDIEPTSYMLRLNRVKDSANDPRAYFSVVKK